MPEPHEIVQQFHELYYNEGLTNGGTWRSTYWMGARAEKCPLDLWVYQEILNEIRPEVIVETGTAAGGSALFLACMCDLLGTGRVLSVDIATRPDVPQHPRIHYLMGSSTDDAMFRQVQALVGDGTPVLVILDSDHSMMHVLRELELYSPLVTPGSYLIVEDTNVNGHPVYRDHGPGPMEALDEFLRRRPPFTIDSSREKFFLTQNPRGFLRKDDGETAPYFQRRLLAEKDAQIGERDRHLAEKDMVIARLAAALEQERRQGGSDQ